MQQGSDSILDLEFNGATVQKCVASLDNVLNNRYRLHDYQKEGVRWMLEHEFFYTAPRGGIMAFDVGLGKTNMTIALMRANPKKTLIVSVVSTLHQWRQALNTLGGFKPYIVLSSTTLNCIPEDAEVVLTTYSVFQKSSSSSSSAAASLKKGRRARLRLACNRPPRVEGMPECLDTEWGRIVLDEGHQIRNPKTRLFENLCKVGQSDTIRWALSATPLQNCQNDLVALGRWVGLPPNAPADFINAQYCLWKTQDDAVKELRTRRERELLQLQKLESLIVTLDFNEEERESYDRIHSSFLREVSASTTTNTDSGNRLKNVALEGITRLRQLCVSDVVYRESVRMARCRKRIRYGQNNTYDDDDDDDDDNDCKSNSDQRSDAVKTRTRSTKIAALCDNIKADLQAYRKNRELCEQRPLKSIVFCSFLLEMQLITDELAEAGITAVEYHGSMSQMDRETVLDNFLRGGVEVLVAQITCACAGLNLQEATRVHITSPSWNPCVELQAIGRAHRQGQTQPVRVYRYVMRGTVEEQCLEIQRQKMMLIAQMKHGSDAVENEIKNADDGYDDDDDMGDMGRKLGVTSSRRATATRRSPAMMSLDNQDLQKLLRGQ